MNDRYDFADLIIGSAVVLLAVFAAARSHYALSGPPVPKRETGQPPQAVPGFIWPGARLPRAPVAYVSNASGWPTLVKG